MEEPVAVRSEQYQCGGRVTSPFTSPVWDSPASPERLQGLCTGGQTAGSQIAAPQMVEPSPSGSQPHRLS